MSTPTSDKHRPFPPYDGKRYNVGESVGHQLYGIMTVMRREIDRRMALHGLTDAQWRPLWLLKIGRASTPLELAREMDCDAGSVTRLVDRLESKGLVERTRCELDRRVVQLRLTPQGETTVARVPHVLASVNNDVLRGMSESDWKQLRKLLTHMAGNCAALQAERGMDET